MKSILDEIEKVTNLSDSDRAIIQYINTHLDEIPNCSSRELGRRTYTSSTAVLRLIRKLNFNNYNDFKIHIVSRLKDISLGDLSIAGNEDYLLMVNKFTDIEINIIQKTKEMLSMDTLKKACELLEKRKYIDIIANDANADIASYACHNFYFVGKIAKVYHYSDAQLYESILADKNHIVIVMTKYGKTKGINVTSENLKARGIPVIAFLNADNKNFKYADCIFYCVRDNSLRNLGDLVYNISTKYLFDLIFSILFSRNYENTISIENEHQKLWGKSQ